MTRLAQQALCEVLGIWVKQAGSSHPHQAHPDDYAQIPVLNFDAGLNGKVKWQRSKGDKPRPLTDNAGYNFQAGDRKFAIIGPKAIDPDTWLNTRQFAQHELALVIAAQPAGRTDKELELQAWTEDFRGYFHQYLALPLDKRPNWQALVTPTRRPHRMCASSRYAGSWTTTTAHPARTPTRCAASSRSGCGGMSGTLITDLNAALPGADLRFSRAGGPQIEPSGRRLVRAAGCGGTTRCRPVRRPRPPR